MSAHDFERERSRWWEWVTMLVPLGGVSAVIAFALTNHPHRAVFALVATLAAMAILRLFLPGRPWFASRNRWMDSALLAGVAAALWYFSPFTATMGLNELNF